MISLPLVYTILALVAYTTSFWYLFLKLMAKRDPNHWFIGIILGLGILIFGFESKYIATCHCFVP